MSLNKQQQKRRTGFKSLGLLGFLLSFMNNNSTCEVIKSAAKLELTGIVELAFSFLLRVKWEDSSGGAKYVLQI